MTAAILQILAPIVSDIAKRLLPGDADRAQEIEREVKLALLDHTDSLEKVRGEIVLAEAKSQHWLTATWRPALMWIAITIIAVNFLIFPMIAIFYPSIMVHALELPDQLWNLLTLGVGGYIVGRSGEKMIDKWKD